MRIRLAATLVVAASFVLPAAPAAATVRTSTLTYQCKYPRIGTHALTAAVKIDLPEVWGVETPTPQIELSAGLSLTSAQLGDIAGGLEQVNGSAVFSGSYRTAEGTSAPFKVSARIPNRPIVPPIPDTWELPALTTNLAPVTFDEPGSVDLHLDKLALNLRALDANGGSIVVRTPDVDGNPVVDSDGDPNTFDVPCTLSPPEQATKLASIDVLDIDGSVAGTVAAQCKFPLAGILSGGVEFSSGPVSAQVGKPFALDARMNTTFPNMPRAFDAPDEVDGTLNATLSLVPLAGGAPIPVTGALTIGKAGYVGSGVKDLVLDAFGSLTGGAVPVAGDYALRLESIRPNLTIYGGGWGGEGPIQWPPFTVDLDGNPMTDSDGDPYTLDSPCKVGTDGASTVLGTVTVPGGATPTPTPSPSPSPTPVVTPTPSPSPTPGACPGSTAKYSYALQGQATLNTLTKGRMPLTGAIDAVLCLSNGSYTAQTVINDTQGRLTALGFLPVTVGIGIIPSGATTGTLEDDVLTANLKARIKVKSAKVFGAIPLFTENTCQSKQLSDIKLKSTDSFDPTATGGTIGGTFAISDLNGCGLLTGILSPLTAGGGNTITAKLTPKS